MRGAVVLAPWPLAPGMTSRYTLTFTPGQDITINGISLILKGEEQATKGAGEHSTRLTHLVHEQSFTLTGETHLKKGQQAQFTFDLPIPPHAPFSFRSESNVIAWTLDTHIDIPNWPDWQNEHALEVVPRAHLLATSQPPTLPPGTPQRPSW